MSPQQPRLECQNGRMTEASTRNERYQTRHVRFGHSVTVVGSEDFLTRNQAADLLGKVSVGWLEISGVLERATLDDGTEGLTVRSVEREIAWQATATRWMRARRQIGSLLRLPWIV